MRNTVLALLREKATGRNQQYYENVIAEYQSNIYSATYAEGHLALTFIPGSAIQRCAPLGYQLHNCLEAKKTTFNFNGTAFTLEGNP